MRLLGELLGETLRVHAGDQLFEAVERVRTLAKTARAEGHPDFPRWRRSSRNCRPIWTIPRARLHALPEPGQRRGAASSHSPPRAYLADPGASAQPGSCRETFARLVAAGITPDRLYEAVSTLRIELVLTAHPTEVSRRTLIHKYNRLATLLAARDRTDLTIPERGDVTDALRREIVSAWETDEVRHDRPTPLDEVRGGLVVFEQSLWDALPGFLRSVDAALIAVVTGRELPLEAAPIRFGSWMGGDRDGNPNVTPEVTRKACLLARWQAADLYLGEIVALRDDICLALRPNTRACRHVREPYAELLRVCGASACAARRVNGSSVAAGG